ncbi:hypothetical protein DFH07DRAFT_1037187 [Mycena maculata]|uniref:SH3 domain-containing protein n=1 Tax=Mycena maculata TaxID=230809 RepID=A0AAD7N655_9AGAR|nr:hypothetical protein DFH07DRAFT_1037187 [Mycena maculata]
MASAVVSDQKEHHHPPHLSIIVDSAPSASPFPSPSSSFVPPPIPGAHEFAMKPAPPGKRREPRSRTQSEEGSDELGPGQSNGRVARDRDTGSPGPTTPRPLLDPASASPGSATTPTAATMSAHATPKDASSGPSSIHAPSMPKSDSTSTPTPTSTLTSAAPSNPIVSVPASPSKRVSFPPPPRTPTTPATPATPTVAEIPSSSRPAPPSPALSRRTSAVPGSLVRSSSSASSRGSASATQSRRTSRVLAGARHRLSRSTSAADAEEEEQEEEKEPRAPITVRDFAFPPADARHAGLGPDVPPQCDPRRLARKLRGAARLSDYSDAGTGEEEEEEGDWGGSAFLGRLRMSLNMGGGTAGWASGAAHGDGVGAADFARNFGDEGEYENEGEGEYEDEDGLYYEEPAAPPDADVPPGLYRAQFAFSALDAAEMPLVEGQLVHVLGAGAAGWAVAREREPPLVLDALGVLELGALVGARRDAGRVWEEMWEKAAGAAAEGAGERRALVPDSFLVMIRGEGEGEEEAKERLLRYLEWVERERQAQEAEEALRSTAEEDEGEEGAAPQHAHTRGDDSPDSSEYEDAVDQET